VNISLFALTFVFLLIIVRQIGRIKIQIWQAMLIGAAIVLITGEITPGDALQSIDMDVMLFLFGMFVVGQALEESGYLAHVSYKYFRRAKSIDALMLYVLFGAGVTSTILMNDTLAVIGTPVMLLLARKHDMSPKLLLLALCFGVTIGSVMSPIGNPQNLLIAINGRLENPFVTFLAWLCIPTLVNLVLTFFVLKHFYRGDFHDATLTHSQEPIRNHELALLAKISLHTIIVLVFAKIIIVIMGVRADFRLTYIALATAFPILVGSPLRWHILKRIDWYTLAFFAAMFVLMESVWQSGFFQSILEPVDLPLTSVPMILGTSTVLSQFISNVPLVALFQPMLLHAGATVKELMALAAGSTIAGNVTILGAASNVIIIQNAERKSRRARHTVTPSVEMSGRGHGGEHPISFIEFAKIGLPLAVLNLLVYYLYFLLMTAISSAG
jgi:Na+/H+ antiporter NhaD/arsenite permease-like protein